MAAQRYGRNVPVQQDVPGVDETLRHIMRERHVDAIEAVHIYLAEADDDELSDGS